MRLTGFALIGLLVGTAGTAAADVDRGPPRASENFIEAYEPNTIGYTHDDDDVGFLDFTISLKYRLLPKTLRSLTNGDANRVYFAFTGRYGFYVGTRESSPVIGKRFNPKFIWRYVTSSGTGQFMRADGSGPEVPQEYLSYLDFAYAHESNGQSIDSPQEYVTAQANAERPSFANDYLSRGWDYLEVVWKKLAVDRPTFRLSTYLDGKYFLHDGLLQGRPEEYNSWEMNPEGKPRSAVDGLSALLDFEHNHIFWEWRGAPLLAYPRASLTYVTGYDSPFEHSTFRLEVGAQLIELPVTVWYQNGYNSDLAQYFKKVASYGVEIKIGGF
jgi:hypothetical protein